MSVNDSLFEFLFEFIGKFDRCSISGSAHLIECLRILVNESHVSCELVWCLVFLITNLAVDSRHVHRMRDQFGISGNVERFPINRFFEGTAILELLHSFQNEQTFFKWRLVWLSSFRRR